MTAALEAGELSAARPDRTLPPGKTRYPFYRRLGGPQGRSGRAENLVPTGIESRWGRYVLNCKTLHRSGDNQSNTQHVVYTSQLHVSAKST